MAQAPTPTPVRQDKRANPYDTLGLPRDDTMENVKRRHRELSLRHHPDKRGDEEAFKRVQEAYEEIRGRKERVGTEETGEPGWEMYERGMAGLTCLFGVFVEWVEGRPWSDAKKSAVIGIGAAFGGILGAAAVAAMRRGGEGCHQA